MKATIHVHQAKIKKGEDAIIVRTYKGSTHHRVVNIEGPCVLVQSSTPDRCGARVWIEAKTQDLVCEPPLRSVDREREAS